MFCGQCGYPLRDVSASVRVTCPRCGWSNEERPPLAGQRLEALAAAMTKRYAIVRWKPPPMSLAEMERLFRGNMQLAEALGTVRPTVALIERCHAALQKHGIDYRAW